jgi:glutamyl-tRNA reductase
MYESLNRSAVAHLFRVSSGLDSLILGESQILGQVRAALTAASEAHSVKAPMSGLFHGAIRVGRKVREHTAISRNALSISYAGVRLAERVLGGLHGKRVMLIGAGEAGQLVATALRTSGADQVTVVNRTIARAEALAGEIGGKAAPFDKLSELLHTADIVIAATDAPEPVVTYDMAQASMAHREYEPLFFFDLAVPRDVESSVATLPGVSLYNVDDLSAIAEENLEDRRRAATAAEAIVDEETDRFMRWWESLDAVPIIRDLRQQAEWIREKEVLRALKMMPGLTDEQSLVLEAMSRSIVKKLLHDPTLSLKQLTDKSRLQTAKDLFCLWDNDPTQGQG